MDDKWNKLELSGDKYEYTTEASGNSLTVIYREINQNTEPELVIKSSGRTFVAKYRGEDYIYLYTGKIKNQPDFLDCGSICPGLSICTGWNRISEIRITDDLALLRAMVMVGNKYTPESGYKLRMLIRVKGNESDEACKYVTESDNRIANNQKCRIATVDDIIKYLK